MIVITPLVTMLVQAVMVVLVVQWVAGHGRAEQGGVLVVHRLLCRQSVSIV